MSDLTTLKNIGARMAEKLKSVGVESAEDLLAIGSKEAFLRLKLRYPETCLVFLYALQGAVADIDYNRLSEDTKADLKEFNKPNV